MRISGMKYKEDADTTNEINIYDLKKNRRRAGDTLSNVRSDRDSLSLDYYYKPKENIEISTSFNKSKFTRKINQDSHPIFTDRKSTRLNSSHANISYAVFCLKKKK